ncbi:hypothetical protein [Melissococcus plutonius]|nr:hypothetical protein [Melissococcus plutonius]KMT32943.1 hypothetical protein MEPL6_2c01590 [Melissococcus plutonius]MCV2498237.1 hypothetical protein [Melissococcus plutonius]MCV2506852.1 hypothetical protein [Melissococcus plutonius]
MTLEQHLKLADQMAKEWHEENDRPLAVRKSMQHIARHKKATSLAKV